MSRVFILDFSGKLRWMVEMDAEELFRKIPHYDGVHKLPPKGGTVRTARFEKPKLQQYGTATSAAEGAASVGVSTKHSERDDLIHCGLASNLYFRLMQKALEGEPLDSQDIESHRFQIMLEQQCIISLAAVFETFVKSIASDIEGFTHVPHKFSRIEVLLARKGIQVQELGDLKKRKHCKRMRDIVDFLFRVRNLAVHNGGIVDKPFQKHYGGLLRRNMMGKLIRIGYSDIYTIRSWTSYLVQEICKKVPGYHKVWLDYIQSVGIYLLSGLSGQFSYVDGSKSRWFELKEGGQ